MAFVPFTEADQPTMAAFNQKFKEAIQDGIDGGLQIVEGSYVGTGHYGEGNKNSLSFPKPPKFLMIGDAAGSQGYIICAYGVGTPFYIDQNGPTYIFAEWTNDGKTITWYSTKNSFSQCNESRKYNYKALVAGGDA